MRTLTWLPGPIRQGLIDLDPARGAALPSLPSPDEIIARIDGEGSDPAGELPVVAGMSRPGSRLGAVLAGAAVVACAAIVLALTVGRSQPRHAPVTLPQLPGPISLWAAFPVNVHPRPIVLLGDQTAGPDTGFENFQDKAAFLEGKERWPASVHESARAGGQQTPPSYPLISARTAFALLPHTTGNPPTPVTLLVSAVTLTQHTFMTDRGSQQLPAWAFSFDRVRDPVYVLAVAAAARYPARLTDEQSGDDPAVISKDGRTLTIRFIAHQDPGVCRAGFESSLSLIQATTTVVLAVTTRAIPSSHDTEACNLPGIVNLNPLIPGSPDTRSVTLSEPLGNRVVVNIYGKPYQVTPAA